MYDPVNPQMRDIMQVEYHIVYFSGYLCEDFRKSLMMVATPAYCQTCHHIHWLMLDCRTCWKFCLLVTSQSVLLFLRPCGHFYHVSTNKWPCGKWFREMEGKCWLLVLSSLLPISSDRFHFPPRWFSCSLYRSNNSNLQ